MEEPRKLIDRRNVLRSLGAAGAVGLAGCSGGGGGGGGGGNVMGSLALLASTTRLRVRDRVSEVLGGDAE